jgi:hypothetical protein
MTQQRRDEHSTEFGLWLRDQPEIDSKLGYVATNIDYVWRNYKTGEWMIIEEKRYGHQPKFYQEKIFELLNWCCNNHPKFHGVHILVFENTSPEDGCIYWDGEPITKDRLLSILTFSEVE